MDRAHESRICFNKEKVPTKDRLDCGEANKEQKSNADQNHKQIVKKYTPRSGAAFYCSCRRAKNLIEHVKPVWHFPESKLIYYQGTRHTGVAHIGGDDDFAKIALEFSRIENVQVSYCVTDYVKTVVLSQIAAVGGVGRLGIGNIHEDYVQLLIAAAKAETVAMWDDDLDPTSATFEDVKNLHVNVTEEHVESYWRTKKLFELARNRKSISLQLWPSPKKIIASFIENWVRGEKTGTLERLSFILRSEDILSGYRTAEERRATRKAMKKLTKSHIKTEQGYIVERVGLDRLRVCPDFAAQTITFHFLS